MRTQRRFSVISISIYKRPQKKRLKILDTSPDKKPKSYHMAILNRYKIFANSVGFNFRTYVGGKPQNRLFISVEISLNNNNNNKGKNKNFSSFKKFCTYMNLYKTKVFQMSIMLNCNTHNARLFIEDRKSVTKIFDW